MDSSDSNLALDTLGCQGGRWGKARSGGEEGLGDGHEVDGGALLDGMSGGLAHGRELLFGLETEFELVLLAAVGAARELNGVHQVVGLVGLGLGDAGFK